MRFARRMERLGTETAFEVFARAKALEAEGRSICHLELGEPDFATPAPIVAAGKAALDEGRTGYGPAAGDPELRDAIADYAGRLRCWPWRRCCLVPAPIGPRWPQRWPRRKPPRQRSSARVASVVQRRP